MKALSYIIGDWAAKRFEIEGIRLEVPAAILTPSIRRALDEGWYERAELHQLRSLLQPGEIVMEIGAGIGLVSAYCAKDRRVADVHAYEANPALMDVIRRNHEINGVKVAAYHAVLGEVDGEAQFYLHEGFWASSLLKWDGAKEITVPQVSFARELARIKPTLIICDIEGGELRLFENVDLSGVRKILLEVHQAVLGRDGVHRLFSTLHDHGFHYDQWHSSHSIVLFSHVLRDEVGH